MKVSTIAYLIVFFAFLPVAYGQPFGADTEIPSFGASEIPEKVKCPTPAEMDVFEYIKNTNPYVCFDVDSARCLLKMRKNYPKLELRLNRSLKLNNLRLKQITTLEEMNINRGVQVDALTKEVVSWQKKYNSRDSFWRSPYLWFGIGLVLGIGSTVGIVYLVR